MWCLLVFTYFFVALHGFGHDLESRIMYSERADITNFPYFAALKNCGAAIISESWLVTAAHCVALDDHKFGPVWVGGNNIKTSQQLMYDTVVIHPEFKMSNQFLPNNIALLRLTEPLTFTDTTKPVNLPGANDRDMHDTYAGATTADPYWPYGHAHTMVGKGMRQGNLMKIEVTALSLEECLGHFSLAERILMYPYRYELDAYICAKRVNNFNDIDMPGLSQGASGSPLVHRYSLEGLAVAFGDPLQSTIFRFIKVARHTEWIRFITGTQSNQTYYI